MIKLKDKLKHFFKISYKYIILVIISYLLLFINLPYVVYAPGGAINLNERIVIDSDNKMSGSYNMAYVSMLNGNIPLVLLSFIIPNWDLVKSSDITYEDESIDEMLETDRVYYEEAINNATISAFREAKADITINGVNNEIVYIASYAETDLSVGDILISVDGIKKATIEEYKEVIDKHEYGDVIKLVVLRNGESKTVNAIVKNDHNEKKLGMAFVTLYDIETDPKVEVKIDRSESGPSGGLMIALSIYDNLTKVDLTKNRKVVGTGTIDSEGNVGEIGGIKYKILGAIKENADIFFCPEANYEEAKKVLKQEKSNLKLISVSTLKEAILALS